jgi:acylphosphatase
MDQERRRYVFRGHVQGVGFRATAAMLARGFEVAGAVRNQDDGGVELIAQGAPAEIDRFITALRQHFGPRIHSVEYAAETTEGPALAGFAIRY